MLTKKNVNSIETSDTELENEDNTLNGNSPNEKLSDEELFNLHLMNKQELLNYNNNWCWDNMFYK